MKGFYIYEVESRIGTVVDCLEIGNIDYTFTHQIDGDTLSEEVKLHALVLKGTKTKCSPDDIYDFETGALIALMKMCGVDKVTKACDELYKDDKYKNALQEMTENNEKLMEEIKRLKGESDNSWKNYQRKIQKKQDRINELEKAVSDAADVLTELNDKYDKAMDGLKKAKELDEYREKHIKELEEENEKLKLDCEKLQHGYNDMIFCGGRQNGKQYTALVELFKKTDQKKVDAAYKEAYDKWIAQPIWQKEVFKQIHKDQLASLLEAGKYLYKIPTKREEMWEKIFTLHKESDVIIVVEKEDVNTFLHEIENKIPEITWASGVKIFETNYTIGNIYGELKTHDTIYFRLSKQNTLTYSSDPDIYRYKDLRHIDYLPPMRWDLFEKGRLVVKVDSDNYEDFYNKCEVEIGRKPHFTCKGSFTVYYKKGTFHTRPYDEKIPYKYKVVNWEDVRENKTTMEDPYDTWKW